MEEGVISTLTKMDLNAFAKADTEEKRANRDLAVSCLYILLYAEFYIFKYLSLQNLVVRMHH